MTFMDYTIMINFTCVFSGTEGTADFSILSPSVAGMKGKFSVS